MWFGNELMKWGGEKLDLSVLFFLIFCIILNYRGGWYKGVDSMLFFDNF